ncbi:MAG: hypothetical protein LBU38_04705, partial [Propionibacteriaceae bacterium]|nr:hypothetical protein [Propionibacteriaceae bacterium]
FLDWLSGERAQENTPVLASEPSAGDIEQALSAVETLTSSAQCPTLVKARVRHIIATLRQTLPRLGSLGLGSFDAYSVIATATNYLPEAINSYLRLPSDWANTRPIVGNKTSLMLLVEQLDLLDRTTTAIFDAANAADAQALIVHGKFLATKFAHSNNPLAPDSGFGSQR